MLHLLLFLLFIVIIGYTIYNISKKEDGKIDEKKMGKILVGVLGIAAFLYFFTNISFKQGETKTLSAKQLLNKIDNAFSKTKDIFPANNETLIVPSKSAKIF